MTVASPGNRCSHSSASVRLRALLTPIDSAPRKAKILSPTLATVSPSQGESSQAPGRARAASRSRPATPPSPSPLVTVVASPRRGAHLPQLLLQLADLVAKPGRELEVQLCRSLVHLRGELLDEPGEVGSRHVGRPVGR